MTPETKEMREATQPKSLEETQVGPIVAVQYPEKWEYSENEESAGVIAQKYAHFKTLSPDDKEGYKDLVLAIADVRTRRTDVAKQEKVIKDPLNKFRDVVIKTSKHVRGLLGNTEDALKLTKTRIDDIREERKLAMERLWQENLNAVRIITNSSSTMTQDQLRELLISLKGYDFDSLDFGDYLDQAKEIILTQIGSIIERIEFLKEQQRLEEERQAFEKKQAEEAAERKRLDDERKEREAAEQKKRDDEKAEADRKQAETDAENQKLRDQIAAMQKEVEPEHEDEKTEIVCGGKVPNVDADIEPASSGRAAAIEQEPESTVVREEPKQTEEITENLGDRNELNAWVKEIESAINNGPATSLYSDKATRAVNAVYDQLNQITEYLTKTAESLR